MKFELFHRRSLLLRKRWYFREVGSNGEIVSQSQSYVNEGDALSTVKMIKRDAADAEVVYEVQA